MSMHPLHLLSWARTWALVGAFALALAPVPAPGSQPAAATRRPAVGAPGASGATQPPRSKDSVRFAVIGDSGTGGQSQYDVGARLAGSLQAFPFEFVLMLGDNIYGSERPQDFVLKFEKPYAEILARKIPFYASLGNHDDPNQRFYQPFNMNGKRFYSFTKKGARFFALDSNYMDKDQQDWLARELEGSRDRWKIAFFHHPLYSSGARHGSEVDLRDIVEPLFHKVPGRRRLRRPRALLRAPQAAAWHPLLHERRRGQAAGRQHPAGPAHGQGLRYRLFLHARRNRRRADALPDPVAPWSARRLRHDHSRGRQQLVSTRRCGAMTGCGLVRSSSVVVAFAVWLVAAPGPSACACDTAQQEGRRADRRAVGGSRRSDQA